MQDRELKLDAEVSKDVMLESQLTFKYKETITVYNDLKNGRKLVDNYVAYKLGFISFDVLNSNQRGYCVITDGQISLLAEQGYDIKYIYWEAKLKQDYEYQDKGRLEDNYQINKLEIDINNPIKDQLKNNYTDQNLSDFDKSQIDNLKELRTQILDEYLSGLKNDSKKKL